MQLNEKEQLFLAKRAKLVQTWRYVGGMLLSMLIGLGMWLFFSTPLLANPFFTMTQLKNNSVPESTMALMAAMLPIAILACLVVSVTAVLFVFGAFSNEKKYLTIIQRESQGLKSQAVAS